jgi:phospholipid/cholesterol/gamma-HCH transport system permease protein
MGQAFKRFLEQLGDVGLLTRECVRQALRRPFEGHLLVEQLDSVGVRSLNVVNLTAIFTGMVLALQMGQFLARFGAKIYISRIMALSLFREIQRANYVVVRLRIEANAVQRVRTDSVAKIESLGLRPLRW